LKSLLGRLAARRLVLAIALILLLAGVTAYFLWPRPTSEESVAQTAENRTKVTLALSDYRDTEGKGRQAGEAGTRPLSDDPKSGVEGGMNPDGSKQLAAAGLAPHPDPMLVEKGELGPLPIVGKDGRRPWLVYSRPFSHGDERPRVAVVVMGLGISESETKNAIDMLPGSISFSFAPFVNKLKTWIEISRAKGHEVLLDLPMEPLDYPRNDPGPQTLLTDVPFKQNLRRLNWVLSRATGYVGVSTFMGSGFTARPRALKPVLTELNARGLMLLDTRENPLGVATDLARDMGLPVATNNEYIDQEQALEPILQRLNALEQRAKENGAAVAVARPHPLTVKSLKRWIDGLDAKGFVLAPVSALVSKRKPE
jgi:polysaccharide deacetylase 2 family uncharacterized protein YibQ